MNGAFDAKVLKAQLVEVKPQDIDTEWFFSIYPLLIQHALSSDQTDKCNQIDALSIWEQRGSQMITQGSILSIKSTLAETVTDQDVSGIFDFICDFWTDSGAALGSALRDLFVKTMSLLQKIRSEDDFSYIVNAWTRRILQFPKKMRIVYFGLENLCKHVGGRFVLKENPSIIEDSISFIHNNGLASSISRALNTLVTALKKEMEDDEKVWTETWAKPTLDGILKSEETYQNIQSYFLPLMFKAHPKCFPYFITYIENHSDPDSDRSLEILADCTKIGLSYGISRDFHENPKNRDLLTRLLQHESSALRVSGLSLIVADSKGSSPVSQHELKVIRQNADCLFYECDSFYRNKIVGLFRNLFSRIRGHSYSLAREYKKGEDRLFSESDRAQLENIRQNIKINRDFCVEMLNYFKTLIRPGVPHQCLISGTHMVAVLVRSGMDSHVDVVHYEKGYAPYMFSVDIYTSEMIQLLVGNVMNSYEDARILSCEVLKMCPRPIPCLSNRAEIKVLENRTQSMLSGMRGREGDSGARLAELVFYLYGSDGVSYIHQLVDAVKLETKVAVDDIVSAVLKHPIHGYFTSLRFILDSVDYAEHKSLDSALILEITNSIVQIWDAVKSILSHESPEGNIPDEFKHVYAKEMESTYGPLTQVVLSYAWRAVKESTLLLNTILSKVPDELLPDELVLQMGDVILAQLASVKHRGAFSSVYPSFIACCKRCVSRKTLGRQPVRWLNDNILFIKESSQYITRRSSGLPFLIVAVLASMPDEEQKDRFKDTLDRLLAIAKEPVQTVDGKTDLPQVHAFNCIKVMFTDAELKNVSTSSIDVALELAIGSFADDVWSIRNCAVMLFTALQNRLFGHHNEGFMPSKLFFMRHWKVHPVLLDHLRSHVLQLKECDGQVNKHVETVYPVLSLLVKLKGVSGYQGLDEFVPLVQLCLSSRIWKIREMAASAMGSMIVAEDVLKISLDLLANSSITDQNTLHGCCLALQSMFPNIKNAGVLSDEVKHIFEERVEELLFDNNSPQTRLAYFRVMKLFSPKFLAVKHFSGLNLTLPYSNPSKLSSSERYYRSEVAEYALTSAGIIGEKIQLCIIFLADYSYEVKLIALKFIEKNIEEINTDDAGARILSKSLFDLFVNYDWDEVRGKAISLYSKFANHFSEKDWAVLFSSVGSHSTEEVNNSCVEGLGTLTATWKSSKLFEKWIKIVREYSEETQEYTTRQAALTSIIGYLKNSIDNVKPLGLLYGFLSDDDSELREQAREFSCTILGIFSKCNIVCEEKLIAYIAQLELGRTYMVDILTSTKLSYEVTFAWKPDNLLFTIEKQNLYRNDLAQVAQLIDILESGGLNESLKSKIKTWLDEGKQVFEHEISREEHASRESWPNLNAEGYVLQYKVNRLKKLL